MGGSLVSEKIDIQSYKGKYSVLFSNIGIGDLNNNLDENACYIVDSNIASLYQENLNNILSSDRVLIIDATEESKSLDRFPGYVDQLVKLSIRRGQPLVAIGGGVIQDITCFLAATMLRGLPWIFYPTTLLAQADSCIGSKSSINSGDVKNVLGTFTPPNKIIIDVSFLATLDQREIHSGIGEMIKVHAINSPDSFNKISQTYEDILTDSDVMESFIYKSLLMKKKLVELDEFDQSVRNVMNYGHSFGHAIETATNYAIPHGIAVTIGMDMANYIASKMSITKVSHFVRMHSVLEKNIGNYRSIDIDQIKLLAALEKDKKNTSTQLRLILPDQDAKIAIGLYDNDKNLSAYISDYFAEYGIAS